MHSREVIWLIGTCLLAYHRITWPHDQQSRNQWRRQDFDPVARRACMFIKSGRKPHEFLYIKTINWKCQIGVHAQAVGGTCLSTPAGDAIGRTKFPTTHWLTHLTVDPWWPAILYSVSDRSQDVCVSVNWAAVVLIHNLYHSMYVHLRLNVTLLVTVYTEA